MDIVLGLQTKASRSAKHELNCPLSHRNYGSCSCSWDYEYSKNHRLSAAPVVDANGSIIDVFSASDVRKMPSISKKDVNQNHDENRKKLRRQSSAERVVQAFASLNKLDMRVYNYIKNDQKKDNPAITVTSRDTLQHVCNLLSTHSIHRVYIVDHLLRPCGVVSIADVLQAIVAPNVPFDIMQCPVVFNRIHSNMIAPMTTCCSTLMKMNSNEHRVYVDDPLFPTCCVYMIGESIRHENHEVAVRVLDLTASNCGGGFGGSKSSSSNNSSSAEVIDTNIAMETGELLLSERKINPKIARSIAMLSSWVVRRVTNKVRKSGTSRGTSIMWCGLIYENGSIGMLHTVKEHRRQKLAQNVVQRLMKLRKSTSPPPVLYIEISNHASRNLFEQKLKWTPIANVAWIRYVQVDTEKTAVAFSSPSLTTKEATATTTSSTKLKKTTYRGTTVYTSDANVAKWEGWYDSDMLPPWDLDGRPCFALIELLERMPTFPQLFPHAVDVGTGGGSNAIWLKRHGFERVVGIDCSEKGLELARSRNHQNDVEFIHDDLFHLKYAKPKFDFLVDIQVFHAIYHIDTNKLVRSYAKLLKKRGVALVVAGNDREDGGSGTGSGNVGPTLLSKEDLIEYFTAGGFFHIAEIKESRFDRTGRGNFGRRFDDTNAEQHGDGRVSEPPLCWVCLFVRTGRRL